MTPWGLSRYALAMGAAAAMLAACGASQPPLGAPGAMPQVSALSARINSTNYKVVYSFGAPPDGSDPQASLINVSGTLYGTTSGGGSYSCSSLKYSGCGTVFSITPGGTEHVLHSFGGHPDGAFPLASLIDVKGMLYGTTAAGGSACYGSYYSSCGTVFSISPSGAETVFHRFAGFPDGASPFAGLIELKGTLYGTTYSGGSTCYSPYGGCGTVFSIATSGTEGVLHSFRGHRDGAYPFAGLIAVNGRLYGTTFGGTHYHGTVFNVTMGGAEKVLHGFGAGSDGIHPRAGLIDVGGTLYGTTTAGGAYSCGSPPTKCGTVFSITPRGIEKVLYSFAGGSDGANPEASLIVVKGRLYGTTESGGAYRAGTVFSITPGGTEKVLHTFGGGTDGRFPSAGLIDVGGMLYGTTGAGGTSGNGTVFALTP